MNRFTKVACITAAVFIATNAHASSGIGNIDDTLAIERVAVASDGKLYAWNKEGGIVPGWPKDLSAEGRHFSHGPRLTDLDLDQKQEIIAVSETASGSLMMHVFRGSGAELANWRFSIPDSDIIETPIVADINRDSSLEIVYATLANDVRAFRRDFRPIPAFNEDMDAPPRLTSGDPDNDGLANLFAAAGGTIFEWDEYGAVSELYRLPSGEEIVGGITIRDITRDNLPELVFSTSTGRILAIDSRGGLELNIRIPSGSRIVSPVVVDDIDIDREPEFIVITNHRDVLVYKTNGEPLSSWNYKIDYREPPLVSGVVANDLYRGLFSTITGFDQNSIYRTRHNSYSRIKLGENVREWDTFANFDYLEMIEVFDIFTWPKPFTPNGDGVNDVAYVHYRISDDALVALDLYDAHERFISRVRDKVFERAGEHQAPWSGVDTRGTVTPNDDAPLDTGLYLIKVVAESPEGFVTQATVSAIVNGVKAEIEIPRDDNETDSYYPSVYGIAAISGIATDPNFGEDNLDADFQSYKLYYRPGVWSISNEEIVAVGNAGSAWLPLEVPLRHQCPADTFREPADSSYPNSNVSCRPVQHGVLGSFNTTGLTNGEYTILLKVMDSNGNTIGKVNYDTRVVTVANPVAADPFDPSNPYDPNNPANPRYLGPSITGVSISNASISRQSPSTTISYRIENETSSVHVTIFAMNGAAFGAPVATYSFNYQAPNDAGNPQYGFTWNGTTSLGRNVAGGNYGIKIEADAVDGTGHAENDSLRLAVARGFSSSDVLGVENDSTTGSERFSATPSHFNPLAFVGAAPQRTHISYTLTKEARVTLTVLENIEGAGLVLKKTISSDRIREHDDGTEFWDGTGDSGLVLPVGRDYILRLTAVGIDVGNEETITRDITVHLDATALDSSITSDITQLKGDDGITVNDGAELTAIVGNPDFLWRAAGTGYVEMPFSYTISASGTETWPVRHFRSETYRLYAQRFLCYVDEDFWGDEEMWAIPFLVGHISPYYTDLSQGIFTVPTSIDEMRVYFNPRGDAYRALAIHMYDNEEDRSHPAWNFTAPGGPVVTNSFGTVEVPFGSTSLMASADVASRGLNRIYVSPSVPCPHVDRCGINADALDQCAHYRPEDAAYQNIINSGALRNTYGGPAGACAGRDMGQSTDIWDCGSATVRASYHVNVPRTWGPHSSSGISTIISNETNPNNNVASYSGEIGNGGSPPITTNYSLSASNVVNGFTRIGSAYGTSTVILPGLRAWLDGSGNLSAQVPITTYNTASNDAYLASAPYQKIWGAYQNFNQEYYRRSTNNISIYNDGYRTNIFSGSPGTSLYSFSNVVHLNNWDIEVRYPNISVTKPDGDNALASGSGHLDVFGIEKYVTPVGARGNQNSNIEDYFKLNLLPLAVPRTFVEIRGSADANYELYYYDAREETPSWHAIEPRTHNPVANGILAHWDVTELNGENYTVVLRTQNGSRTNEDTFDIGIGARVDTSSLADDEIVRVYTPFKRASLIFTRDSIVGGPELITINAVKPDRADFRIPTGVTPLGPIFDIKPDDIEINPDHHVQLEITYTPDELRDAFGVADASELTIYNLAGDEMLEGLATIITFDDMDDDDPTNDVWRFTASLEHFSQYFLARKISGYFHIDSPVSDAYLRDSINIRGRVEALPRAIDAPGSPGDLAELTSLEIGYYPESNPAAMVQIYSASNASPTTALSAFDVAFDVSALNGSYVLNFEASGPQGTSAKFEMPVAIDNAPTTSMLLINGMAVPNGGSVTVANGAVLEIKASDNASEAWQSGVSAIELRIDGGGFGEYAQPINLWLSNGAHTVTYRSVDENGNVEADKSATIILEERMTAAESDAIDLNLTIGGPSFTSGNQTWVGDGATLGISSAGGGAGIVKYRFDDSEYRIYSSPVEIRSVEDGLYVFEYFALNDMGLRGEIHTRPLLLDATSPQSTMQVEGLSRMEANRLTLSPATRVILAAADLGDTPVGLARIEYSTDGGPWGTYSRELSFTRDTQLQYRAVDLLGNYEAAHIVNILLDDTAPTLEIVSMPSVISPNADGRHDTAEFVISATDDLYQRNYLTVELSDASRSLRIFDGVELSAGENRITWDGRFEGAPLTEGIYACTVTVTDEGGNRSGGMSGQIVYDLTPPEMDITNGSVRSISPNGDDRSDILQVDYTVADNLFAENLSVTMKILSIAEFELASSGNTVASPPHEHMISWNGTNAMQNGVFDGNYRFEIFAEDPAGNRSAPREGDGVATGEVFVDRYPPRTTLTVTGESYDDVDKLWLGANASIALSATDPAPASGVRMILYAFGSDVDNVYTAPFIIPSEGADYTLYYSASDAVGNEESENTRILRLDRRPPATEINVGEPKEADENGDVFISPETPIALTADDGDGVGVRQIYTEVIGAKDASSYIDPLILSGLGDGLYRIRYWAEDYLENEEARRTIDVNLDQTPPSTEILIGEPRYFDAEKNATFVTTGTQISFRTRSDRGDLQRAEYRINSGEWLPTEDFNISGEGEYTVFFRSFDRLGNEETIKERKIIVDNTPPDANLAFDQIAEGDSELATPDTVITLGGRDQGSGYSVIEYSVDGGEFLPYSGPFSLNNYSAGNHTIRYRVTDRLGNISEERIQTVKLIDLTVKREANQFPRALVLMLQTHDLRSDDPKPNEALLGKISDEGGYIKIITGDHNDPATIEEFRSELRSDKYSIVIFATDAFAVNFYDTDKISSLLKEIKARIYKGDAFISMAGYSDMQGDVWNGFLLGFEPDDNFPAFFGGTDAGLIALKYGRGSVVKFGTDLGRAAENDDSAEEEIIAGLARTISHVMPVEEQNNVGEVTGYTLAFENSGDADARVSVNELMPQGWIETASTGGEVFVIERNYEVDVAARSATYVDYLYRSGAAAGEYELASTLNSTWENGLRSASTMVSAYVVENNIIGMIDRLIGKEGLIAKGSAPQLETNLEMARRRVGLSGSIESDEDINEMMGLLLSSIDNLEQYDIEDKGEIHLAIGEMVENLGALQTLKGLIASFSVSTGDPNDPASYHGDTTSSLGASGGGCQMMMATDCSLIEIFLLILPMFIIRLRSYRHGESYK